MISVVTSMKRISRIGVLVVAGVLCLVASSTKADYIVIQTPTGLGQTLIASCTAQFLTQVTPNQFFPNTYTLNITGPNPSYAPLPTPDQLLSALVAVSSMDYTYGWADGEQYERQQDMAFTVGLLQQCVTPSSFTLTYSSTSTWNVNTCLDALATADFQMYQLNFDTPTVVPGGY